MFQFIFPTVLIGASLALYFGFIDPTYTDVKTLRNESQEYEEAINNALELSRTRNELVKKINEFSPDDMARLEKLLPDKIDNVRLIMEVDRIALRYGMSLREVKVETITRSGNSATAIGEDLSEYNTMLLSFSVISRYETFLMFLQDLEDSLRLLDVRSVNFQARESARGDAVYQFNVTLQTYWLK